MRSDDECESGALRLRLIEVQTAQGESIAFACKEADVPQQSRCRWCEWDGGLKVDQAGTMKVLEYESAQLRRPMADLSLVTLVLPDVALGILVLIRGSSVNSVSATCWFDAWAVLRIAR